MWVAFSIIMTNLSLSKSINLCQTATKRNHHNSVLLLPDVLLSMCCKCAMLSNRISFSSSLRIMVFLVFTDSSCPLSNNSSSS